MVKLDLNNLEHWKRNGRKRIRIFKAKENKRHSQVYQLDRARRRSGTLPPPQETQPPRKNLPHRVPHRLQIKQPNARDAHQPAPSRVL